MMTEKVRRETGKKQHKTKWAKLKRRPQKQAFSNFQRQLYVFHAKEWMEKREISFSFFGSNFLPKERRSRFGMSGVSDWQQVFRGSHSKTTTSKRNLCFLSPPLYQPLTHSIALKKWKIWQMPKIDNFWKFFRLRAQNLHDFLHSFKSLLCSKKIRLNSGILYRFKPAFRQSQCRYFWKLLLYTECSRNMCTL